jgi:hypothetical protein
MFNTLLRKIKKGFRIMLWKITYPAKYIQGKYFADPNQSYEVHNRECLAEGKLEIERKFYQNQEKINAFDGPGGRWLSFIEAHPEVRELTVDIGSGCGWLSVKLSNFFKKVIGIEPSTIETEIAGKLCPPEIKNIEYRIGFAQDELKKLEIKDKTLFVAGCVLSHLPDKIVADICLTVSAKAPIGSLLAFNECWGEREYHRPMWHFRTQNWWKKKLKGWEIDFLENEIKSWKKGENMGFHAIKIK